jgi:hypothetical protein
MSPETPRRLGRYDHVYDRVAVLALLVMSVIALLTWQDFGITWDEEVHLKYGDHLLAFYESEFEDKSALTYRLDYLYGGGFDLSGAVFRKLAAPLDDWEGIHLWGTMLGVLGLWGTWKLGRTLGGPRAGMLAALFIGATSVYWGHMPNNPKDLPFAVGYVWAMAFMIEAIRQFPRVPRKLAVKLAIAIGLAMSVRIAGLLLICFFGLAIAIWLLYHGLLRRDLEALYRQTRQLALTSIGVVAGAWAVMLVWWPWAAYAPLTRPFEALRFMSQFLAHKRKMPFAGEMISTYDVDWRYMPHYFGLKLPEFVVILSVVGFGLGIGLLIQRARNARWFTENLVLGIVIFSILFPWVYAVYKESVLYDGLRHFLFEVPVVVAASAWLADGIIARVIRRFGLVGVLTSAVIVTGLCVDQYAKMAHLHPHQYVYFNRFIGGVEGAVGNYDTDYYAETYGEAGAKLAEQLWLQEPDTYLDTVYRVESCVGRVRTLQKTPPNFEYRQGKRGPFDFWIGYTRKNCHMRNKESPIVLQVSRDGGMLTLVRDVRAREAERKASKRKTTPSRTPTKPKVNLTPKTGEGEAAAETDATGKTKTSRTKTSKPKTSKTKTSKPKTSGETTPSAEDSQ